MKYAEKAHMYISTDKDVKRTSLREQDIMSLQALFLTPGFHCITVGNREIGRSLIDSCISSVNHYSQPAFLGSSAAPEEYLDLYQEFASWDALHNHENLEQYMAGFFYFDVLIIEGTKDLLQDQWFGKFEQLLIDYSMPQTLPIIMLLYR